MTVNTTTENYRCFFGIVQLSLYTEDRHPSKPEVEKYYGKYKNFISIKVFGKEIWRITVRTAYPVQVFSTKDDL